MLEDSETYILFKVLKANIKETVKIANNTRKVRTQNCFVVVISLLALLEPKKHVNVVL